MNKVFHANKQIKLGIFLFLLPAVATSASIKCWTNQEGVRECGNKIPPEYSQGASVKISPSGIVIGEKEAAKSLEAIRREKEALTKAAESKKADQALLKTFSSVEDLVLARNSKTDQIDKEIFLLESRMEKLEEKLKKVKIRLEANNDKNSPKFDNLTENAARILSQITESEKFIETKGMEKSSISDQFERDILRFERLLKPRS